MGKVRALLVLRLSRVTEESTSIERQRQECERLCQSRGYEIVGVAEDPDVSAGKTSPFERPELGSWLQRPEDFDVLVFFRADRLVRSARHLSELMAWAEDHGVSLVSASEQHFDTSSQSGPMAKMFASITAMFAEMELEAIRERTKSSWEHLHKAGKSTGSIPPFGYESYRDDLGEARLRPEPQATKIVREVYERIIDGEGLPAIASDLTNRGELTPRDRNHVAQGRKPHGYNWSTSSLKRAMQSPALQGYAVYRERKLDANGNPVKKNGSHVYENEDVRRNPDGSPMKRAEAILEPVEFQRLQDELERRALKKQSPNKNSDTLLLHVLYCSCGQPMYRLKGFYGRVDRYRCKSVSDKYQDSCGNGSLVLEETDALVTSALLSVLGTSERQKRSWDPGEDTSSELEEINLTLADLTNQIGTPAFRAGSSQRAKLDQRITELAERQAILEANPSRKAGWVYESTGEVFKDWWAKLSTVQRNQYLRDMNLRVVGNDDLTINLGDLTNGVKDVTLDATADEYIHGGRPLGSLYHDETLTVYGAEVSGPYDELRAQGYTVFAELDDGTVLAAESTEAMADGNYEAIGESRRSSPRKVTHTEVSKHE